ncbi:MAG TPA: hypothetical protein VMI31_06345 [Fimbriimonadaceae bacterium]|nr:hypothetical protein [Fimbriimonadaceae bacterium]
MRLLLLVAAMIAASSPLHSQAQFRPRKLIQQRRQIRQNHPWRIAPQLPPALKKALGAVGTIRYQGTRVIETRNGLNRQQHTEYVLNDGMRSRIEFPEDSPLHGQIIIETASERLHYIPGRNVIERGPPVVDEAYARLAQRAANGNVVVTEVPGGAVANVPTELVTLTNKQGETLQKLWIEPGSGMILKRELYTRGGVLSASFEFTQVNLNPRIDPTDWNLPRGARIVTPEIKLVELIRRGGFADVRLPADSPYKLEAARVQKIADRQVLVQQYAGNGRRVVLYQTKAAVDPGQFVNLPNGVRTFAWRSGASSFVLMGDIAENEIQELGHRMGG